MSNQGTEFTPVYPAAEVQTVVPTLVYPSTAPPAGSNPTAVHVVPPSASAGEYPVATYQPTTLPALNWPQSATFLGSGSDAREVIITAGVIGGAWVNSGTPMAATVFEATSPAPSATLKAWYMAIDDPFLKVIRVDIEQSAGQLSLTVSHARYANYTVDTANIDNIFGSMTVAQVATSNSSSGYGAASVTYQIAATVYPTLTAAHLPNTDAFHSYPPGHRLHVPTNARTIEAPTAPMLQSSQGTPSRRAMFKVSSFRSGGQKGKTEVKDYIQLAACSCILGTILFLSTFIPGYIMLNEPRNNNPLYRLGESGGLAESQCSVVAVYHKNVEFVHLGHHHHPHHPHHPHNPHGHRPHGHRPSSSRSRGRRLDDLEYTERHSHSPPSNRHSHSPVAKLASAATEASTSSSASTWTNSVSPTTASNSASTLASTTPASTPSASAVSTPAFAPESTPASTPESASTPTTAAEPAVSPSEANTEPVAAKVDQSALLLSQDSGEGAQRRENRRRMSHETSTCYDRWIFAFTTNLPGSGERLEDSDERLRNRGWRRQDPVSLSDSDMQEQVVLSAPLHVKRSDECHATTTINSTGRDSNSIFIHRSGDFRSYIRTPVSLEYASPERDIGTACANQELQLETWYTNPQPHGSILNSYSYLSPVSEPEIEWAFDPRAPSAWELSQFGTDATYVSTQFAGIPPVRANARDCEQPRLDERKLSDGCSKRQRPPEWTGTDCPLRVGGSLRCWHGKSASNDVRKMYGCVRNDFTEHYLPQFNRGLGKEVQKIVGAEWFVWEWHGAVRENDFDPKALYIAGIALGSIFLAFTLIFCGFGAVTKVYGTP